MIESASETVHLRVELPPLATQESAVKDNTFGHDGGAATGRTLTRAVKTMVCVEQPLLLTVRV